MPYQAVHLQGGNQFDDVRLDIGASFDTQDAWLAELPTAPVPRQRARMATRRALRRVEPYRLREATVNAGLRRRWFEDFHGYWQGVLDGRPLTVMDFHNLRFAYRMRAQTPNELSWADRSEHLANWQAPYNIFQIFEFVYRGALHPAWGGKLLFDVLRPKARVLEYGCALAPMYATWRTFLTSRPSTWVLADIPGFAFHYARHAFARDAQTELAVIRDFDDPLAEVGGGFDVIIVQTVFEHLDNPRQTAEYLLDRLNPGGLIWFDYIRTSGTGLDTPAGLAERRETLEYLAGALEVVHGELRIDDRSLGSCVGRKRGPVQARSVPLRRTT